jgi:hypothetical protein
MLRPLLFMVLLFFLVFGLSGMHALMIESTLAAAADKDVSSEDREEQTLRMSASRRHARGEKRTRTLIPQLDFPQLVTNKPPSTFASLSPPHSINGTGKFHDLLQVFRF